MQKIKFFFIVGLLRALHRWGPCGQKPRPPPYAWKHQREKHQHSEHAAQTGRTSLGFMFYVSYHKTTNVLIYEESL